MRASAVSLRGPAGIWLLTASIAGLAAALFFLRLVPADPLAFAPPAYFSWPLLALGFYLAEIRAVHLHFRREAHSFTLTEIPLVFGLLFVSPLGLLSSGLVGTCAALALVRRQRAIKLAFNLSLFSLSTVVSAAVLRAVGGPVGELDVISALGVLGGTTIASALGVLAIFLAISLMSDRRPLRELAQPLGLGVGITVANTTLALGGAAIVFADPALAWLLVAPTALLYVAYRTIIHQRRQHRQLELFYTAVREINESEEIEPAILGLLAKAREAFGAEVAAMALFPAGTTETALLTVLGPADRSEAMNSVASPELERLAQTLEASSTALRVDPGAPDRSLVAALLGVDAEQAMIGRVDGRAGMMGLLIVADPVGDVGSFKNEDASLFGAFAAQAGAPLEAGRLEKSLNQLMELEEQLTHQAFHDTLTGLANRALFIEQLEHAAARSERGSNPIGVLFADLDDFKSVNDTLGHAAGDELLAQVAARLRAAARPEDTVARLGGDEFAVLLDALHAEDEVVRVAERIIRAFEEPFALARKVVDVSASVGVVPWRTEVDATEILRDADIAMYRAKASGKRQYIVFTQSMLDEVTDRLGVRREFERALVDGQVVVHYQPIVQLDTGTVTRFEALARWQHPARGTLLPGEFVPLLEGLGTIAQLDRWVLREACLHTAAWNGRYPTTPISVGVNISAQHLETGQLAKDVSAALDASGLAPPQLVLEVTESAWAADADVAREVLESVRRLGVGIALDDFGRGYSSLSYLHSFPITALKIDKTFVQVLDDPEADPRLTHAIVQLAATLSLEVVAEGIETPTQLGLVRELGCNLGQGFLFSEAIDAAAVGELLREQDARRPSNVISVPEDAWSRREVG